MNESLPSLKGLFAELEWTELTTTTLTADAVFSLWIYSRADIAFMSLSLICASVSNEQKTVMNALWPDINLCFSRQSF